MELTPMENLAKHNSLFIGELQIRLDESKQIGNIITCEKQVHLPHDIDHFIRDCKRRIIELVVSECLDISDEELQGDE